MLLVAQCYMTTICFAGLKWRGQDLNDIYKGAQLPLGPAVFNSYSYPNGGKQIPASIPANTLIPMMLINYYTANTLKDNQGDSVHLVDNKDVSIDQTVLFPRLIWFLPWQPFNPHLRLDTDIILPIATVAASLDRQTGKNLYGVGGGGVGDIIWGPIELFITSIDLFGNGDVLWSSYETPLISFPSGSYNPNDVFNVGSNVYSVNLISENWFNFPKLGPYGGPQFHPFFSYTHHTGNDHFSTAQLPASVQAQLGPTTTYTTGDFAVLNLDAVYPVLEHLVAGVNCNFLWQISNDSMAGSSIVNSAQQAISIGPELDYMKGPVSFSYKASFEVRARNEFKGMNNWFVLTYTF